MTIASLMQLLDVHDVNEDIELSKVRDAVNCIDSIEQEMLEQMDKEMRQWEPELYDI